MKNESKTIVFFGNERLATCVSTTSPVLRALLEAGYKIEVVIANYTDPVSRQKRDLEIGQTAQEFGIPVILPGDSIALIDKVKKHRADIAVLVAFGKIIPQSVIDLFPYGIINIHPSILPSHRGPTPIESVILDGSTETGVSLMNLEKGMDSGAVYAQTAVKLAGNESKQELADKLSIEGCRLLIDSLPKILNNSLNPIPQNNSKATYDSIIKKEDGIVDWTKPAMIIEREVRAYLGWPGSKTEIKGKKITIIKAHITEQLEDSLDIECGDGKYLSIDMLVAPSGRRISARDFINGYL